MSGTFFYSFPVSRLEGWEGRLLAVIEAARHQRYELGQHDCFRVACAAIEALTGVDRWPEWAGRYSTRREALHLIAQYGHSFEHAFSWFFGTEPAGPKLARRGDICALATPDGEKHLGVCMGVDTAFLAEPGLLFVPTSSCLCCWRVG